ncbi:MAG TPA: Sua5/YciO/YrdC/YwlC family protein [Solirubrobacter sp.]|nr:Sua5/YciO/YrdC/YwlC family protein [Solirubrobacter sp.]
MGAPGLAKVASALHDGDAVVIPFPSPLPYVVAATEAAAVNQAKGRPGDQPCGMLLGAAGDLAPHLDLDPATVELSIWIAQDEQANLLVPLLPGAPRWLSRGSADGLVGITLAWLAQTRPLADEFGHLFVSSANQTAGPVAVTAGEADDSFHGERLVLDGDPFRDASTPQGSATIIEVRRAGVLRVVRDGVNNRSNAAYLQSLRDRFDAARCC